MVRVCQTQERVQKKPVRAKISVQRLISAKLFSLLKLPIVMLRPCDKAIFIRSMTSLVNRSRLSRLSISSTLVRVSPRSIRSFKSWNISSNSEATGLSAPTPRAIIKYFSFRSFKFVLAALRFISLDSFAVSMSGNHARRIQCQNRSYGVAQHLRHPRSLRVESARPDENRGC